MKVAPRLRKLETERAVMSDVYAEIFYHFVWATKQREPMIIPQVQSLLFSYLRQKCAELNVFVYALNAMPDHIHLACSLPTSLSVAECVKTLKGGSSHFLNRHALNEPLCWQSGYGVLTFARPDLARIVSYVEEQQTHHASSKLFAKMEQGSLRQEMRPGS